ncbi:MAG: anthranilate phosphoribosyltransferase [Candidatus Diapherotrites archaeon]|nr:anthranilate phosphoribosyltransferase [Candidatus Diapherotrites archaeon]
MIEDALNQAFAGKSLGKEQARQAFDKIMSGRVETQELSGFLKALAKKGETIEEILGAAESMNSFVSKVNPKVNAELLDVVGTGGDAKDCINASTAAAIIASAAGCLVAKHGNRKVSSNSGAADVLENLGVNINLSPRQNEAMIEKTGFAFLFAPLHHPAMKHAAEARKQLGIRTIFNLVGPLTNPASAQTMLLGVFNAELAEKYSKIISQMSLSHALIVNGIDGFDEISICNSTRVFEVFQGVVKTYEISPEQFGLERASEKELQVSNAEESANEIKEIFCGKKSAKADFALLNAGAAIYVNGNAKSIAEGIKTAQAAIDKGAAKRKLEEIIEESNRQL